MNRRLFLGTGSAGLALLAAPGLIGRARAQARVTLKLGHLANEQNVWHKAALRFAEEAARLSGGRIEVQVFPNDTLGREMDLINGMQLGTADMTITGESLQNWAPLASLLAVPYGLTSLAQLDRVAGGPIGRQIEAEIVSRARIRPLAYFARGPRNLTSNRPIRTPDELNGLRLRVPNVPLFVAVWSALGARPTPMAFGEVFTSLQNGTIDAQENPLSLIRSANFNEVQKFVNRTEHVRSWIYLAISERRFQSLSAADREAVTEAARRAQAHERALFLEDEKSLEDDLRKRGMTFIESDQQAFAAKARPAAISSIRPEAKALLEQILALGA
ncbi:TRAP transporter substrate-binding protein [Elioraea sp.]|jgi:tripartite ATP-independent transporter DctP family solute receptor|uniref:TRAP transporter substrate-binding protein n=1 Tax=Elioraea sp. TaxID=2185103 RepID=UPI0021DEAFF6|nr:TRAP transporter substrate-binding protein [Elioraea sp.]GIX10234.1 MAG: C4-dicarboxylate ABC transporter substrate-binding protein [Elioraea sp.]